MAMKGGDRFLCIFRGGHFHEAETTGSARHFIDEDSHGCDLTPIATKKSRKLCFFSAEWQISDVKFLVHNDHRLLQKFAASARKRRRS
jgi:hypothetical protein